MLVLSRRVGERILLSDGVEIMVTGLKDGSAQIGIKAPNRIRIFREEIADVEFLRRARFVRPVHRGARQID